MSKPHNNPHFERAIHYEMSLGRCENLVFALRIVMDDFVEANIEDPDVCEKRSAVVGIADALEQAVHRALYEEPRP